MGIHDEVNLQENVQRKVKVLQSCFVHLKGRYRQASRVALEALHKAVFLDNVTKLFSVLPFWLLFGPGSQFGLAESSWCVGSICSKKASGEFFMQRQPESPNLFPASEHRPPSRGPRQLARKSELVKCVSQAQRWLQEHRKRCMNSKTDDLKCNSVLSQRRFLSTNPSNLSLSLDRSKFLASLRSALPGPGECTCEHLKILLDDTDTTELLMSACNILAQGKTTKHQKRFDGSQVDSTFPSHSESQGVLPLEAQFVDSSPGHQPNSSWRNSKPDARLSSTLCRPEQALIASVTCYEQPLTQISESQSSLLTGSERTIMASMLGANVVASIRSRVVESPMVRRSGGAHVVTQAEGGEQGDPLMPLLLSTGIQGALEEVAASLLPGEQVPLRLARGSIGKGRGNSVAPGEDEGLEQSRGHPR